MTSRDPYHPAVPEENNVGFQATPAGLSTGRAAYNTVSDVVVGVNIRRKDNLFQAWFILVTAIIGAIIGGVVAGVYGRDVPWWVGSLAGAFAGLVVGLFLSGIVLMIYRGARHLQGKHD